jgi:hypothetical protein
LRARTGGIRLRSLGAAMCYKWVDFEDWLE